MPLTATQVALLDILTSRLITTIGTMKKVPTMTEEEVATETAKWEQMSDDEMDRMDRH